MTWQYRIRVTGPDKTKWFELATKHKWGSGFYSWPMVWDHDGEKFQAKSEWYNVRVCNQDGYAEFFGNFNGTPALCFGSDQSEFPESRSGPPLFDGLRIEVEIVGLSWCTESPTNVCSYRDVYINGVLSSRESADNASVADRYAPELSREFPDEFPDTR